jgi:hypothetical protein
VTTSTLINTPLQRGGRALVFLAFLAPASARACAACYGQSDSPLAQGMNWGIFSLLGTIILVLGGFATFFVYLARKSAAVSAAAATAEQSLDRELMGG